MPPPPAPDPAVTPVAAPLPFKFVGGSLPLDFVNTVDWLEPAGDRFPPAESLVRERIGGYADLLRWAREAGALADADARPLAGYAERHPYLAREAHERALALRAAIRAVVTAASAGERPPSWSADILDAALVHALQHRRLALADPPPRWRWDAHDAPLDRIRWDIAWSAAELLTSTELPAVRTCMGEDCGWMYVDRSRNHRRRWCEMAICGNRAKARRHYARHKNARER